MTQDKVSLHVIKQSFTASSHSLPLKDTPGVGTKQLSIRVDCHPQDLVNLNRSRAAPTVPSRKG
ncbi:hypothetical protein FCV25MIE_19359, partial [Fagus crenata]